MYKRIKLLIASILGLSTLISCAPINHYDYVEGKINIVTTTTMLGDLAKSIGGDDVSVTILMKPGVDPHSYNPKPSDARALAKADLVVINGLHLEAKMGDVLLSIDANKRFIASDGLVALSTIQIIENMEGQPDPHIWGDVNNWMVVAETFKEKMMAFDPSNASEYESRYNAYQLELSDLEQYIEDRVNELSAEKKVLITAHDAFAYFGRAHGFSVHSIQGISTQSEASVKDIQDLANLVVALNVKAIFVETSVPENTIRSVIEAVEARGRSLNIGGHLYSDSLGDIKSGGETYIKMCKHNVDTIVDALI
ncbi:MAG TPA: zinc ABC transporter substrate-binding protein [Bacilli bacterium]|nr:zinc ABC transporter substrate-binding protein [Bacilli bacterium]